MWLICWRSDPPTPVVSCWRSDPPTPCVRCWRPDPPNTRCEMLKVRSSTNATCEMLKVRSTYVICEMLKVRSTNARCEMFKVRPTTAGVRCWRSHPPPPGARCRWSDVEGEIHTICSQCPGVGQVGGEGGPDYRWQQTATATTLRSPSGPPAPL